jgi:hypothetical protein
VNGGFVKLNGSFIILLLSSFVRYNPPIIMTVIFNEDNLGTDNKQTGTMPTIGKAPAAVCPRCKNKFCDRIKRGAIVKLLLPGLAIKRYRCAKCLNRFYKRG